MHLIGGINIENLLKAQNKFEQFRKNLASEQEKAGAVQAFEFCYELAWKTIKRLLEQPSKQIYSPRDAFREGAIAGLITTPDRWFEFIQIRNLTVHTYDERNIEVVIATFENFSKNLADLVQNIKNFKC